MSVSLSNSIHVFVKNIILVGLHQIRAESGAQDIDDDSKKDRFRVGNVTMVTMTSEKNTTHTFDADNCFSLRFSRALVTFFISTDIE